MSIKSKATSQYVENEMTTNHPMNLILFQNFRIPWIFGKTQPTKSDIYWFVAVDAKYYFKFARIILFQYLFCMML